MRDLKQKCTTVDEYLATLTSFQSAFKKIRKIFLELGLAETIKWGGPCYVYAGKNVVGMGAFKSYFTLWFFQGALIPDDQKVLINAQEGVTKALRQWRIEDEIKIDLAAIRRYTQAAIDIVKEDRSIKPDRGKPLVIPAELTQALQTNKNAEKQFAEMGKGKQREYADYIAEAAREETKQKRIEKILPMIEAGIGLNDKYRK